MFLKSDNSKITKTEIDRLINGHAGASSEEAQHMVGPESVTASVQLWRSADQGSRVAIYDSRTRGLFITTQRFINLTNAKNRQITPRANRPLFRIKRTPPKKRAAFRQEHRGNAAADSTRPSATPAK
jgi:hypothetical protein